MCGTACRTHFKVWTQLFAPSCDTPRAPCLLRTDKILLVPELVPQGREGSREMVRPDRRQQVKDVIGDRPFPVRTWMIAGSCLIGLAVLERYVTGPLRKKQEAAGAAPSVSIFGDISVVKSVPADVGPRELPDGSKLLADGSIQKAR